jgi:TolA-binding protein
VVPTIALAGVVTVVDIVCVLGLSIRVTARVLTRCLLRCSVWALSYVPRWSLLSWRVILSAVIGLLMVSCQPMRPLPPQPSTSSSSEPRFLPALPAPQTPPGVGSTASRAEQRAAFSAAEALRTSDQPLQARQAFADFVRRYPDSDLTDDALLALGHISATLEQYAQAVPSYRSLLERFPRSERVPEAHLGLGVALYYRQDYPNSLIALRQYLTLAPAGESRGLAHYYLGATALKQQRYTDAIADLKAAMESSRDPAVVQRAREYIATTVRALLKVDALTTLAQ